MSSPTSNSFTSGEETSNTQYSSQGAPTWGRLVSDALGVHDPFTAEPEQFQLARNLFEDMNTPGAQPASNHRQIGGLFGVDTLGNPLTTFIMVVGKHKIDDYELDGRFSEILRMPTLNRCHVRRDPERPHEMAAAALLELRDTRAAEMAIEMLNRVGNADAINPTLFAKAITAAQFCMVYPYIATDDHLFTLDQPTPVLDRLGKTFMHGYDGQLIVQIEAHLVRISPIRAKGITDITEAIVSQVAEVKHIVKLDTRATSRNTVTDSFGDAWQHETFVVELYNHRAADRVVETLQNWAHYFFNDHPCEVVNVWTTHYEPGVLASYLEPGAAQRLSPEARSIRARRLRAEHFTQLQGESTAGGATQTRNSSHRQLRAGSHRPSHPCTDPLNCPVSHFEYEFGQQSHSFGPHNQEGRRPSATNPANFVDMDRVAIGSDTRTTLMLRNIPSELNFAQYKHFIDQFLQLKYDFLYLRVDFQTMKNVGYGFLNIDKPQDVLPFLEQYIGKLWPIPGTTKRVEVSYANVQTISQIIEKFRNSSVMLQPHCARPHLYHVGGHPLQGQERDFPPPDNGQKQLRSSQNAQAFGLYSRGRVGRHSGNFDRGNPNDISPSHSHRGNFGPYRQVGHANHWSARGRNDYQDDLSSRFSSSEFYPSSGP